MDEHIQKTIVDYQAWINAQESLIRDKKRLVNDLFQMGGVSLLYPDVPASSNNICDSSRRSVLSAPVGNLREGNTRSAKGA